MQYVRTVINACTNINSNSVKELSLDIVLKCIKAVLIYNMLRYKECCFLVTIFTGIRYVLAGIHTKPFAILCIMHSLASFFLSDGDLHPNVWSISVTLKVLWWRYSTH